MKLLSTLCLLLALAILGCGGKPMSSGGDAKTGTDAIEAYKNGPDAVKDVTDSFTQIKEALGRIKDTETADQTLANVELAQLNIVLMKIAVAKSPPEVKTALAGPIDAGVAEIEAMMPAVEALPGVKEIMKPRIDKFLTTVKALKN